MNTIIIKNRKMSLVIFTFSIIVSLGIIMQGYSMDTEEEILLDASILESQELEDYILVGADFKQSLTVFAEGLNKIDISKLEVTYEKGWKKVIHLPVSSVSSFGINEKVRTFNDKKEALLRKYPQMASFSVKTSVKYYQQTIQNSVKVKGEFLKKGINASRPLLKSGTEAYYNGDLMSFLADWQNDPNYVEIRIYLHDDGTWSTFWHTNNTEGDSAFLYDIEDNKLYTRRGYSSSPVVQMGYTNKNSEDKTKPKFYPNEIDYTINQFVYYNNRFYYYK
jgi:hypothetical protein